MQQKSKYIIAGVAAIALVLSAYLISLGIRHFSGGDPVVRVTGMSERHITSDLAVLTISFQQQAMDQKEAYQRLQESKRIVSDYLQKVGFAANELFSSNTTIVKGLGEVNLEKVGYYYEDRAFSGYRITESITVRSSKVDEVEKVSATISNLITQGVEVETSPIAYYYTKLNDLKVEMLKEASADAHSRASIVAEGGAASLGKLQAASMGVFQVLGRNQAEEEYSWGGTLNTTHKEKTATVTVKASYVLE